MKNVAKHLPLFIVSVAIGTTAGLLARRFSVYNKLNYAKLLSELRYDAGYLDSLYGRDYAGDSSVIADICRRELAERRRSLEGRLDKR